MNEIIKGGWSMNRTLFSEAARKVLAVAIDHRRHGLKLPDDALRGVRFNDDGAVLARLESMYTEVKFMSNVGPCIDKALEDAGCSDWWYTYEKRYDDNYNESGKTEIADED